MDFLIRLLQDYKENIDKNPIRIIPFKFLGALLIGLTPMIFFFVSNSIFESKEGTEILLLITATLLTFNGLILALSWSAITKTYEILTLPIIRNHLHAGEDYGEYYFFYIEYVRFFQFLAITISGFLSISFLIYYIIGEKILLDIYFVILTLTAIFSVYSIVITKDLVKTIHILLEAEAKTHYNNKKSDNGENDNDENNNKGNIFQIRTIKN